MSADNAFENAMKLEFEDYSDHPPPPHLSFEEYQHWIFNEIYPALVRDGKITTESLIEDFNNNEGRVTEWPDFSLLERPSPAPRQEPVI